MHEDGPDAYGTVLLFGGPSSERRVAVASAQHIVGALPRARLWFWEPGGAVAEVTADELRAHERVFEADFAPRRSERWASLEEALDAISSDTVLFLCLHGSPGEDGTVQELLDQRGIPYTGSNAASSALAWNKTAAKEVAAGAGLAVAEHAVVHTAGVAARAGELRDRLERWGGLVAKPVQEGSSDGLRRILDAGELHAWVAGCAGGSMPDTAWLVEQLVRGREFTVGVVDEPGGPCALPVTEIVTGGDRPFDYVAKYLDPETQEITPAPIDAELAGVLSDAGVAAHRALACRGHSRSDFVVDAGGRPVFLETNTLPGLTRASFIPQQLAVAGIPIEVFVGRQIEVALEARAAVGGR